MMSETELLMWVRGPGLQIATFIFLFGVVVRIGEILMLGRKKDLSVARGSAATRGKDAPEPACEPCNCNPCQNK